MCCLLVHVGIHQGFVTWGSVTWPQHNLASHLFYEGFDTDRVFLLTSLGYKRGTLDMISKDAHATYAPFKDLRFVTISSITLWVIWKVCCSHILSVQTSSLTDTLREIWSVLLHTLRSQWDLLGGSSRAVEVPSRSVTEDFSICGHGHQFCLAWLEGALLGIMLPRCGSCYTPHIPRLDVHIAPLLCTQMWAHMPLVLYSFQGYAL